MPYFTPKTEKTTTPRKKFNHPNLIWIRSVKQIDNSLRLCFCEMPYCLVLASINILLCYVLQYVIQEEHANLISVQTRCDVSVALVWRGTYWHYRLCLSFNKSSGTNFVKLLMHDLAPCQNAFSLLGYTLSLPHIRPKRVIGISARLSLACWCKADIACHNIMINALSDMQIESATQSLRTKWKDGRYSGLNKSGLLDDSG